MNTRFSGKRRLWQVLGLSVLLSGTARAESEKRLNFKGWHLQPSLDVQATYDSNVNLDGSDEDDFYGKGRLALDVSRELDLYSVNAGIWGDMGYYGDFRERSSEAYGEKLGLTYAVPSERLKLSLSQRYGRITDYDDSELYTEEGLAIARDRSDRQDRDLFISAIGLSSRLTDKTDLNATLGYSFVDYRDDATFDNTSLGGSLELAYRVTDKSAVFVEGGYTESDSDGNASKTEFRSLRAGAKTVATDKVTLRAGFGMSQAEADSGPDGGTSTTENFNFDVSGSWKATEKLSFALGARNGVSSTADAANNSKEVTEFSLSGNYNFTAAWLLNLTGGYTIDEYANPVPTEKGFDVNREQEIWLFRARLSYTPPADFMTIYADAQLNMVDDNAGDEYEQYRITIGVRFWY